MVFEARAVLHVLFEEFDPNREALSGVRRVVVLLRVLGASLDASSKQVPRVC